MLPIYTVCRIFPDADYEDLVLQGWEVALDADHAMKMISQERGVPVSEMILHTPMTEEDKRVEGLELLRKSRQHPKHGLRPYTDFGTW